LRAFSKKDDLDYKPTYKCKNKTERPNFILMLLRVLSKVCITSNLPPLIKHVKQLKYSTKI